MRPARLAALIVFLGVIALIGGVWLVNHQVKLAVQAQFEDLLVNTSSTGGNGQISPTGQARSGVGKEKAAYELINGWNLIAFPVVPDDITSAAELMVAIAKQGGYVTTVSAWDKDKWKEYSQRGDIPFGDDFKLLPGQAYFVKNHQRTVFEVMGRPLTEEERQLNLAEGWNAVGGMVETNSISAEKMIDTLNALEGKARVERVTDWDRWSGGNWDGFVKRIYENDQVETYGVNYQLEDNRGYFVKANRAVKHSL